MTPIMTTILTEAVLTTPPRAETTKIPIMPAPQKEHQWLSQFLGEWHAEVEMYMEPGKPPERSEGTEIVRAIGGFWVVSDYSGSFKGQTFNGIFTLGYSPERQKYIATWVDSCSSHLWTYEGALDATGKVLTLTGEGVCPTEPGRLVKVRDTIEFKSKDHRILTSEKLGDDGRYTTGMIINYRRK